MGAAGQRHVLDELLLGRVAERIAYDDADSAGLTRMSSAIVNG